MKKKTIITSSFIILFSLAVFLRIINIADTPMQVHLDEAGLGINAWSIANFGTDRYGNFLPVCPSNFYGEQSAFYTYFSALLVSVFGLNIYTIRLPGVIMGILTVLFGSLIMKEKWGNKGLFTGLALLGICPYFIMNSRFALDCNAMLGTLTIALYSLIRLMRKLNEQPEKNHYRHFLLTGFLFGVVLYTYIISAIVIALFGICFGIWYLLYKKENRILRWKQLLIMALPILVMVIPLVLVVGVNHFGWDAIRTPLFSVPKMLVNRTEEISLSLTELPGKLKKLLYIFTSDGKYGSSDLYWTMYWCSPVLIVVGGIYSIINSYKCLKSKKLNIDICMLFVSFAEIIMFILCGQLTYHINGIFIALVYFCLNGIFAIASLLKKRPWVIGYGIVLGAIYLISFVGFSREYYFADTTVTYQVYGGTTKAMELLTDEQKEQEIFFLDEIDVCYFMVNPISPDEFSAHCNEIGYIEQYKNLHFYKPDSFDGGHIYICNKASGYYDTIMNPEITKAPYECKETEHYYVFYPE